MTEFDGLHKCPQAFHKKEIPFKEIVMADVSKSCD